MRWCYCGYYYSGEDKMKIKKIVKNKGQGSN